MGRYGVQSNLDGKKYWHNGFQRKGRANKPDGTQEGHIKYTDSKDNERPNLQIKGHCHDNSLTILGNILSKTQVWSEAMTKLSV